MHIIFQIPIIDSRSVYERAGESIMPSWAIRDRNAKPFIRGFGAIKDRYKGGIEDWAGEDFFCDAHLAARFTNLHKSGFVINDENKSVIIKNYRRLYSGGEFMNKLEIGFIDNLERKIAISGQEVNLTSILRHYLNLQIVVNNKQKFIYNAAPSLAKSYCDATTKKGKAEVHLSTLVTSGEVCILVVLKKDDLIKLPSHAKFVKTISRRGKKIDLYSYRYHFSGYYFKVWIITATDFELLLPKPLFNTLRDLRINLLHIHAEKEAMLTLHNKLSSKNYTFSEDYESIKGLGLYFKNTFEKLFQKDRYGIKQSEVLDFALQSETGISPGSYSKYKQLLDNINGKYSTIEIAHQNADKFRTKVRKSDAKRVLFLSSSPKGLPKLDIQREFSEIKRAYEQSEDKSYFHLLLPELSVVHTDLIKKIRKNSPDYLHIVLHGLRPQGLCFEDNSGNPAMISAIDFAELLKQYGKKLNLVIFNACNSMDHAKITLSYCNYSIGTIAPFPDLAAIEYAKSFYFELFRNANSSITSCHEAGIVAIKKMEDSIQEIDAPNGQKLKPHEIIQLY